MRRPALHFSPRKGWINDPNGLCFFNGRYHIFYQHNPNSSSWGKMHWGHAVSDDLVDWEELPIALYPDRWYEDDENGGCFSGSALIEDGVMYLVYTAVAGGKQRQCLAISHDGEVFEKHPANPLIDMPSGYTDFRDPRIFRHGGWIYMVIGASDGTHGFIDLYRSEDMVGWEAMGHIYELPAEQGRMPECPDLFEVDGHWVLTFSPVDYVREGAPVMAVIGDADLDSCRFVPRYSQPFDYGSDFYALQSFIGPDGSRLAMAWANGWQWMGTFKGFSPDPESPWCGFMTLPREIRCIGGRLSSYPVKAVWDALSHDIYKLDGELSGEMSICPSPQSGATAVSIAIRRDVPNAPAEVDIEQGRERMVVIADGNSSSVAVTIWKDGSVDRAACLSVPSDASDMRVDMIVDEDSAEIFVGGGLSTASFNIYADGKRSIGCRSIGRSTKISSFTVSGRKK